MEQKVWVWNRSGVGGEDKKDTLTYVINLLYRDLDCNSFPLWWRALLSARVVPVRSPCMQAERPWRRCRFESSAKRKSTSAKKLGTKSVTSTTHHAHLEARHVLAAGGLTRSAFCFLWRWFWLVLAAVLLVRRYWRLSIFVRRRFEVLAWQVLVAVETVVVVVVARSTNLLVRRIDDLVVALRSVGVIVYLAKAFDFQLLCRSYQALQKKRRKRRN